MLLKLRAILCIAFAAILFAVMMPVADAQVGLPGPGAAAQSSAPRVAPMPHTLPTEGGAVAGVVADDNYRLGTGDKMKVTVYGEDDLSGEFTVDGSGQVQFPLVGQVNARGMTVHEFVAELSRELSSKYLRDPRVSVQIENFRPFYIMGEVNKPGEYPVESNLSVLGAIALAGGYTYRANDRDVYIRRTGSSREEVMPANGDTRIYPGDVVRVAERFF